MVQARLFLAVRSAQSTNRSAELLAACEAALPIAPTRAGAYHGESIMTCPGRRVHPPCFIAALCLLLAVAGCEWDKFDPRLGAGGGSASDADCGRIDALSEDFAGSEADFAWRADDYSGNSSASQVGGELVLLADATAASRAYYSTRRFYDFREGSVAVEVTQVPDAANAATTELDVRRDDYHRLLMRVEGADLVFIYQLGAGVEVGRLPYDPVAHRWWRLRHQGDKVYWETSPDGNDWTERASRPASVAFDPRYAAVRLWVSAGDSALGGEAHFDNVTGSGPGNGHWCKATALRDDFAALEPTDDWLFIEADYDAVGRQYGSELVITPAPNTENSAYSYESSRFYDLSGAGIGFELTGVPHMPAEVELRADGDGGWLRLELGEDEQIHCAYFANDESTEVAAVPFSASDHRWWRIREDNGSVYWEASADGHDFQQLGSVSPAPFDLSRVAVRFGAATPTANPDPGQVRIDNFNLAPPQ